ncbi:FAD-binding dehydrogenase [Gordonia sp. (in: high G+C Gram-positive bacteria)]|uniref:FAD-binding dehydrogenase n=1 Tax=Gordonia sp. (in: high G+C Gram-positive bacteria) TaxID=84139 RepID=UPI0016BB3981|nr:FAD-binding dehydrogenase [Gordonia sp. (in: high G+C Gram-positive bacteria)]NLG46291.1 FAD-binding dehydrogenase [Gordonia sp. (in: high G+C Gram-positive bacteria)]
MPAETNLSITRRQALAAGGVAIAAGLVAPGAGLASAGPSQDADVIVVGHGLSGLVAACELADRKKKVLIVDQESGQNLGGQAHWSLGGLFFIDSPEQRLAGVRDSYQRAHRDWFTTAGFDRGPREVGGEDYWARQWAEKYLEFAAGEKRSWLSGMGMMWVPVVGWAERGDGRPGSPGNTVPRFHTTLGTGPGVVEPFARRVREAVRAGLIKFEFRHRVDELITTDGAVTGIRGSVLEHSSAPRGKQSSRTKTGDFELHAPLVIVASGGIGGNHDLVRRNWPSRLGTAPEFMVTGVPAHVDGRMLGITEQAGGRLVNSDRMWHYTEGLRNHSSIWPGHGIRVLGAPTSMWFDGSGRRFPSPGIPSYDTLGTLEMIQKSGHEYSWFVLNKRIIEKEFVLSGSEQNPELTSKNLPLYLANRALDDVPKPVQAFLDRGPDFVTATTVEGLAARMNKLVGKDLINAADLKKQIRHRDREAFNPNTTDEQIRGIRRSLAYPGDSIVRTVPMHRILDPEAGPLIAIKMNILTRKSLGGLQTDLSGRVLGHNGKPVPGLMAVGEAAGFGGGGVHGYRALEGTFLGGCLFTGRQAGRAARRMV